MLRANQAPANEAYQHGTDVVREVLPTGGSRQSPHPRCVGGSLAPGGYPFSPGPQFAATRGKRGPPRALAVMSGTAIPAVRRDARVPFDAAGPPPAG
jgi:hypothetical protein